MKRSEGMISSGSVAKLEENIALEKQLVQQMKNTEIGMLAMSWLIKINKLELLKYRFIIIKTQVKQNTTPHKPLQAKLINYIEHSLE